MKTNGEFIASARRASTASSKPQRNEPDFPNYARARFALLVLHPIDPDDSLEEFRRAAMIVRAIRNSEIPQTVIIYPNNDPGSPGIIRCWKQLEADPQFIARPDVSRPEFLALLRDAAMLIGNSSAGIIEAASFRTSVIDIGPRQLGRERSGKMY